VESLLTVIWVGISVVFAMTMIVWATWYVVQRIRGGESRFRAFRTLISAVAQAILGLG
jgi:hypothetical protein